MNGIWNVRYIKKLSSIYFYHTRMGCVGGAGACSPLVTAPSNKTLKQMWNIFPAHIGYTRKNVFLVACYLD